MATILALGMAAALYPQLLAIVVVILTRAEPKRLLWACYLGAVGMSIGCGAAVLLIFRDRSSVVGSTSHRLGASVFLVVGAIALLSALLVATGRSRAVLGEALPRVLPGSGKRREHSGSMEKLKTRAKLALTRGSVAAAAGAGAILGIPGPFDLLALGRMASSAYSALASIAMIIAFNLVKFLLIEIPILSYTVDPDRTTARVGRLSAWMKDRQITVLAAAVGIIGVLLIVRGITRLN
jgi:hypothetical protein